MNTSAGDPDSSQFPVQFATMESIQLWIRLCPQCKTPVGKVEPSDPWKCPQCGWE